MAHPGLLAWANSIRLTMTSDPGRQVFKEQVQTHGFLFLDDYLENIVSGGKQDPLIELVKTPGRKKAIARKPKLLSSKLANTVSSLSYEVFTGNSLHSVLSLHTSAKDTSINENAPPSNSLQATLLAAKVADNSREKDRNEKDMPSHDHQPRAPLAPVQSLNNPSDMIVQSVQTVPPPIVPSPQLPASMEHNDLSIIAEDDEPSERSRLSNVSRMQDIQESLAPSFSSIATKLPLLSSVSDFDKSHQDVDITSSSSAATFQSIPLRSPIPSVREEATSAPSHEPESDEAQDSHTEPNTLSESMSTETRQSINEQSILDVLEEPAQADRKSSDKPIALSIPTLPEPMFSRKPRDPSLNMVMQGAATPGAVRGKRTSYLTKVREVNAFEGTSKKSHLPSTSISSAGPTPVAQGTKRKSSDMLANDQAALDQEEEERLPKAVKVNDGELASRKSKDTQIEKVQAIAPNPKPPSEGENLEHPDSFMQEGVLNHLKKTVEDFGVRASKTMSKSLGSGAVVALAEARAAAEARVAERDRKEDEMTLAMGAPSAEARLSTESSKQTQKAKQKEPEPDLAPARQSDGRMSISDLFPTEGRVKEKHKIPEKPFQFKPNPLTLAKESKASTVARESTSTTPPNSPPAHITSVQLVAPPVFNKPSPVFALPVAKTTRQPFSPVSKTKPRPFSPAHKVFNPPLPPPPQVHNNAQSSIYPSLRSSPTPSFKGKTAQPLTAHSTLESVTSDRVFDDDDVPAWMPSTQDTDYTSGYTQSQQHPDTQICDEDDSWPIDEKLSAGVQWTFGSKDDSMTWSTAPSQSTRGDTGPITKTSPLREQKSDWASPKGRAIPGAFDVEMDNAAEDEDNLLSRDPELEQVVLSAPKATIADTHLKHARSQSQMSMASIASFESSQSQPSQGGFLNQASKLLSSALGTSSKKKQPEVKTVLQKAAIAAKKQQEEADKKAARLKEMESRRQLAIQRKAEEEKARELEEERKLKEEAERRKKEKEGNTDKRSLKLPSVKKDDESQKKRKIEVEKKPELKKPGPNMLFGKSHLKSSIKQPSNTSFAFGSSTVASSSNMEVEPSSSKGKERAPQENMVDDEISQPSQLVQSQMAARAKAQIDAAKQVEPLIPSESIELPDINSEYSDSEDEDRVRTFDPPDWAQSPELRQALEMQSTINPDDIFGAVRPLKMEELFKTRTSRFRARTSSANWTGADRLTMQEESAYARRMGFK